MNIRIQTVLVRASDCLQDRKNLCCVGDDDQSIYTFRADIRNILTSRKIFRGPGFEQNYRSHGHILAAANSVIRNNKSERKGLWTDKEGSGQHMKARDDEDEAQWVAERYR